MSSKKSGFFTGIRKEFGRITWPSRNELFKTTLVVITAIIAVSVIVYALDELFAFLLSLAV